METNQALYFGMELELAEERSVGSLPESRRGKALFTVKGSHLRPKRKGQAAGNFQGKFRIRPTANGKEDALTVGEARRAHDNGIAREALEELVDRHSKDAILGGSVPLPWQQ
jgi:hypothetical protein